MTIVPFLFFIKLHFLFFQIFIYYTLYFSLILFLYISA
nr:MAG TPA: hypothetical protein [Caudoviricetes sp.]